MAASRGACGVLPRRPARSSSERLAIYPAYARRPERWLDPALRKPVLDSIDAEGWPRVRLLVAGPCR